LCRAFYNLAHALLQTERVADAISALESSLALDASTPDVHVNLGNLYATTGALDKAVDCLRQAADLDGDQDWQIQFNLAVVLEKAGVSWRARAVFLFLRGGVLMPEDR
jgi:Flp pilus assembly protein TadD